MVNRYVTTCDCMSQAAWGDYVRHDDYATLEADNAKLRAELERNSEQYPPCDYCGVVTDYHPWHGSGLINGRESPHIHACNECRHLLPSAPKADDRPLYTCIGKGGEYELVGYALPAGKLREWIGRDTPDLAIYRSETDYFARTRQDFKERMEVIETSCARLNKGAGSHE